MQGNTITAPVRSAAPGVFVVVHADGGLITADRPASAGSVRIVYTTGLGAVTQQVGTGLPAPSSPLAATRGPATVRVGEQAAEVLFSGLTPGFVGLYQINIRVERSLGKNTKMTVAYASVSGFHLPRVRNLTATLPAVYQLEQTARSTYHGASFSVNRRMSKELTFLTAYPERRTAV